MSQTAPTPITALPTAPSTNSPSTFDALADVFVAALAVLRTDTNAISTVNYNNAVDAYNNAVAAAASAVASAASAAQAASTTGVTIWVSGTTYAIGDGRFSPINFQTYRRKTNGAGTTDPSLDATNWELLGASPAVTAAACNFNHIFYGGL